LETGAITESIQVTAEAAALQTDRAEVARNFSTQSVTELPLANRSFQALAGLVAGVTPPTVDFTQSEDPQGTTFFRANGQGNSSNNTLVDGVDDTNPTLGLTIYIPPAEAVQEVHVTTSNYNAEFGRAGGAIVSVATRGGANELHGALYEFHRSTNLRARDFFNTTDKPKPGYIRNQFGAAVGGPVIKNKTFFFGAYQGLYLRQSATTVTTVPATSWLTGDFSSVPGLQLYDPATGNPDGTGRLPFTITISPCRAFTRSPRNYSNTSRLPILPLHPSPITTMSTFHSYMMETSSTAESTTTSPTLLRSSEK
jgi:TonB-dependent Receptor Plug Domain